MDLPLCTITGIRPRGFMASHSGDCCKDLVLCTQSPHPLSAWKSMLCEQMGRTRHSVAWVCFLPYFSCKRINIVTRWGRERGEVRLALPQGPTPHPFIYYLWQKSSSFYVPVPFIDKWYPFHIPNLEHCTPFNCCKCTVFKICLNKLQNQKAFSPFSQP